MICIGLTLVWCENICKSVPPNPANKLVQLIDKKTGFKKKIKEKIGINQI